MNNDNLELSPLDPYSTSATSTVHPPVFCPSCGAENTHLTGSFQRHIHDTESDTATGEIYIVKEYLCGNCGVRTVRSEGGK